MKATMLITLYTYQKIIYINLSSQIFNFNHAAYSFAETYMNITNRKIIHLRKRHGFNLCRKSFICYPSELTNATETNNSTWSVISLDNSYTFFLRTTFFLTRTSDFPKIKNNLSLISVKLRTKTRFFP